MSTHPVVEAAHEEWEHEELDEAWPPIIAAAIYEDWDEVKRLIATGVDVNTQGQHGNTALHYSAAHGNLDITTFLINAGANIELKTRLLCSTPLRMAAFYGHLEVVELLVERGADVLTEDNYDFTPLMWAISHKRDSTASYLRPITHKAFQRRECRRSTLDLKFYILLCQKMAPKAKKTDHVLHRLLKQGICEKPDKGPLKLLLSFMGVHWSDIKVVEETQEYDNVGNYIEGRLSIEAPNTNNDKSESAQKKPGKKARTS